jgi:predicted transcriptional regulator
MRYDVAMNERPGPKKAVREVSSFRLPPDMVRRLDSRAAIQGSTRTALAEQYLEEGLRLVEHPGIRFADGPAGRRAAVVGGPDVWEIVMVLKANGGDVDEVASLLDLPAPRVQVALRYYLTYTDEIDAWLAENDAIFEREYALQEKQRRLFP